MKSLERPHSTCQPCCWLSVLRIKLRRKKNRGMLNNWDGGELGKCEKYTDGTMLPSVKICSTSLIRTLLPFTSVTFEHECEQENCSMQVLPIRQTRIFDLGNVNTYFRRLYGLRILYLRALNRTRYSLEIQNFLAS